MAQLLVFTKHIYIMHSSVSGILDFDPKFSTNKVVQINLIVFKCEDGWYMQPAFHAGTPGCLSIAAASSLLALNK